MAPTLKAPPLQGWGWGGAVLGAAAQFGATTQLSPTPDPSPEGEGRNI